MSGALFIISIIIVAVLGLFVVPRFMMRRAISRVIGIFRQHYALDAKSARTPQDLGLGPRGFMEGMFRGRDYRPYALNILQKGEIVLVTEDGRLYLSEDKLSASGLGRR